MSYRIRLTRRAEQDLEEIVKYTLAEWGADQVPPYLSQLGETIEQLKEQPQRAGRALDELHPGLRYLAHRQHYYIFFRVEPRRVEIIRIIHQRRDWRRLLTSERG